MQEHNFSVSITLIAPFLFPGVTAGRYGFDRVAIRDHKGRMIIPQDQIKGLFRHGLEALGEGDLVGTLFGKKAGDAREAGASGFEPDAGTFFPTDLVCQTKESSAAHPFHRVRIDEESGAALEGHLLTLEQRFEPEEPVQFQGYLTIFSGRPADELADLLQRALYFHGAIGAYETIGFGRIKTAAVKLAEPSGECQFPDLGEDVINWHFKVDQPYLVAADRIADNAYKGRSEISGGALKAVIDRMIKLRGLEIDEAALSALRIGFARQGVKRSYPKSVVLDRSGTDAWLVDMSAEDATCQRPKLQIDWKDEDWALAGAGGDFPEYHERVHTAIKDGLAAENDLFSTIAVIPRDADFQARMDFSNVPAKAKRVLTELLRQPLLGLGRTDAAILSTDHSKCTAPTASSGRICLKLETDAYLIDNLQGDVVEKYRAFWKSKLEHSELLDCYLGHCFAGGYLARRYALSCEGYAPWPLCEAGSVFVLAVDAKDLKQLGELLNSGLCAGTVNGAEPTWKNCPFVPENGFGQISIHEPLTGGAHV